jgi:hypothetical protein
VEANEARVEVGGNTDEQDLNGGRRECLSQREKAGPRLVLMEACSSLTLTQIQRQCSCKRNSWMKALQITDGQVQGFQNGETTSACDRGRVVYKSADGEMSLEAGHWSCDDHDAESWHVLDASAGTCLAVGHGKAY